MEKVKKKQLKTKYTPAGILLKYLRYENLKFKLKLNFRYNMFLFGNISDRFTLKIALSED
jgi:hypothetical protein